MDISRPVWSPLVLNQLKNARVHRGQRVAERTPQPARKSGHGHTHRWSRRVSVLVIGRERRKKQLLHVRAEAALDGPQQPLLVDLQAVARIPIIEAED